MRSIGMFSLGVGILATATALGQGTFKFSNIVLPGRPPITATETEAIYSPAGFVGYGKTTDFGPISGPNWLIDVLVKSPVTGTFTSSGLMRVTVPGLVPAAPVSPLTGAGAGLFDGGSIEVSFVDRGAPAEVMVRAWDRTTGAGNSTDVGYDAASVRGSVTFMIESLGGAGAPPTRPAYMNGFHGMDLHGFVTVIVPEPPVSLLMGMGCLAGVGSAGKRMAPPRHA